MCHFRFASFLSVFVFVFRGWYVLRPLASKQLCGRKTKQVTKEEKKNRISDIENEWRAVRNMADGQTFASCRCDISFVYFLIEPVVVVVPPVDQRVHSKRKRKTFTSLDV